jgi:hypothetical protein
MYLIATDSTGINPVTLQQISTIGRVKVIIGDLRPFVIAISISTIGIAAPEACYQSSNDLEVAACKHLGCVDRYY